MNKDWAILQWTLSNVKSFATTLTNVRIGLEVPISKEGGRYGLGGTVPDGDDDVDGYDGAEDIYWAQDTGDLTTIGFGSAIVSDPITHYYAEDYYADYSSEYINFFGNDTWLYERLQAPSATATNGVTPGNITATVGWDGFNILPGESRTVSLVIAANNNYANMVTAFKDAQDYYLNVATGFQLTEIGISDLDSAQFEVFNNGRAPIDPTGILSFRADGIPLTASSWSVNPIPTYGYSTCTITEPVNAEGATITLFENAVQIDQVSYGQKGIAPDPLDSESTARRFETTTGIYSNDWLQDATTTWDSKNDVRNIITLPQVVLNRVLFYPFGGDQVEEYVEVMYTGMGTVDISGYKIVCDNEYIIPALTPVLNPTNRYYVFKQADMPSFFTNMDSTGDNVYLYDNNDNLLDMVGWSSSHNQGEFMSRTPDGAGTFQGYDDATSTAAGWAFDNLPNLVLTEFYVDSGAAEIELYNPRGGDKVLSPRWTLDVSGGTLFGNWNNPTIIGGGYETFIMTPGVAPGNEGDTISLYYQVSNLYDEVSYGTSGIAPDPISGESTARFWDISIPGYSNDWNRDATDTFGAQNDVPAINSIPVVIMNEIMFNPSLDPNGKYVVLMNIMPSSSVDISNFYLVCDDAYQLPSYPTTPGGFDGILYFGWTFIIRYGDDSPASDNFFQNMDSNQDNVYFYDNNGELLDMVGWSTAHNQAMSVGRVPDGFGTYQGYHDASSVAAGWVFNTPLQVLVTEIADSESTSSRIEVYNSWYPTIDFNVGFTFDSVSGIIGSWVPPGTAGPGQYAVFDVTSGLDFEGDTISFTQNSILIDEISYGQNGIVPDPLLDESVERYWDGVSYTNVWERNWSSGSNFGFQNDVPSASFSSPLMLNEIMFNPNVAADGFVELFLKSGMLNISGYMIVGNTEYIIPDGTILSPNDPFFYLMNSMVPGFFGALNPSGDNVYLYDDNGSLLDMVGWSSLHTQGSSMCRIPNGTGTRDGFDDATSVLAQWQFDCVPTITLLKVDVPMDDRYEKFGDLGDWVSFNLTIWNFHSVLDLITISNSTQEGWLVEIFDETGTIKISDITLGPDEFKNIIVRVKIPDTFNFIVEDNVTISIQSTINAMIRDSIVLQAKLYPFVKVFKSAFPTQINIEGTGFEEETTINLSALGTGAIMEGDMFNAADVIFVVDDTASMNQYLTSIKGEINNIVQVFLKEIISLRLGLLSYKDFPDVHWDCRLTDNILNFTNAVNSLTQAGGGDIPEEIFGALSLAINDASWRNESVTKIIILIGDAPDHNPPLVYPLVNNSKVDEWGIYTSAIACGSNGQTIDNFQRIAENGSGIFFNYIGFMDPDVLAQAIIDSVLTFVSKIDIAARDMDIVDSNPMIQDVLPPYIKYVPGSASIPPDMISTDAFGNTILEWNVSIIKIGENWTVSFNVTSSMEGWQLANLVSDSRISYTMWNSTNKTMLFPEVWIDVTAIPLPPPPPLPPDPKIAVIPGTNDIKLEWVPPLAINVDHYLIYRALDNPRAFDLNTPWINTSSDTDPIGSNILGTRTSWNFTSDVTNANEIYYCIRTVDDQGKISNNSITVGKWTRSFSQNVSTFSIPLETITPMTAEDYLLDMGATYIKWMDPASGSWKKHGEGVVNDTPLRQGEGYLVKFPIATTYTYCGMPAAMIISETVSGFGFDPNSGKNHLFASSNSDGNVTLNWTRPSAMGVNDNYLIYRATERTGFHDNTALLVATISYGTEFWIDAYAAQPGTQYYYMIVPENELGEKGTTSYSIGVWTEAYNGGYDTLGIPLTITINQSLDWFCDNIVDSVGMNYFLMSQQRWVWHSTAMPENAFDSVVAMGEGYQISISAPTKFTFIGV